MNLSVLDLFLLSMLDRGTQSPYDLQRAAGVSLGASVPSLRRLTASKLVTRTEETAATNRPRHAYKLTAAGKQAARAGWKPFIDSDDPPSDLDSLLRVADMAAHYRAEKQKIRSFLKRAAERKSQLAQHANLSSTATRSGDRVSYMSMRVHCDAARLQAEADTLVKLARIFRPKGEVDGQASLL